MLKVRDVDSKRMLLRVERDKGYLSCPNTVAGSENTRAAHCSYSSR